jgi:hypothetical protein
MVAGIVPILPRVSAPANASAATRDLVADTVREAAQKVASLRRAYKLTTEGEAHFAAVEAKIAKRKGSS